MISLDVMRRELALRHGLRWDDAGAGERDAWVQSLSEEQVVIELLRARRRDRWRHRVERGWLHYVVMQGDRDIRATKGVSNSPRAVRRRAQAEREKAAGTFVPDSVKYHNRLAQARREQGQRVWARAGAGVST